MRILSFFLLGLFLPSLTFAQGGAMFSLTPDRGSYDDNESFSVQLKLNAEEPVTSFQASFLYDTTRLSLVNVVKEGGSFPYWWKSGSTPGLAAGEIVLQASSPIPGVQGNNIPIATLNFRSKGNGLAALLASANSLVLTPSDKNVLNLSSPAGAIFSVGTLAPSVSPSSFIRNLQRGSQGADVKALQELLNSQGFVIASGGPGSAGLETDYFGPLTEAALMRYQDAYAAQILHPLGITAGTGYFGPSTRAYMNTLR